MKTLLYTIFFSLFGIHLLAQSNKAVCLDGKDNNLRIGMDTLCRHWTLEAWIKPDNNEWKSQEVIIGGGEYSELNSLDYLPLVIDHGRLCNVATGLVGEEIPKGKWTHVAAVCNGRCTLLYINGREVARKDTATVILPGAIGINESSESAFGGCIDEVRIWKTGLTEKELNEEMDSLYRAADLEGIRGIVDKNLALLEEQLKKDADGMHREVETVKRYIYGHYGEELGIELLAEKIHMAPSYLSALFKKETGQNLSKFIKAYRMEKARQMLDGTREKIGMVAEKAGYPNVSYFCQSFREYYGVSPQRYREKKDGSGRYGTDQAMD